MNPNIRTNALFVHGLATRVMDFLVDLQLYVIASMGAALIFDAIRGLL